MADSREQAAIDTPREGPLPPKTRLRRILDEQPEARPRLGKAVAGLLGVALVTLAAIGLLLVWHIARRGRLIRERLKPPRIVPPLELPTDKIDPSS